MIIIGYSGHSFVVCDALESAGVKIEGYCDNEEKKNNPFSLRYYGNENSALAREMLEKDDFFVSIGDNIIRGKVTGSISERLEKVPGIVIHSTAWVSPKANISSGVFVSANAVINALAKLDKGVIANTGCVIEHECSIGEFAHICPGTVLAGNVTVGAYSFIGANAVVKQGVKIGRNVIVGAGAVVVADIPDNVCVVGNPARTIKNIA
jgi:sugar O-acyltransferase (sialic acid O-acetyltransferase NeuD family)